MICTRNCTLSGELLACALECFGSSVSWFGRSEREVWARGTCDGSAPCLLLDACYDRAAETCPDYNESDPFLVELELGQAFLSIVFECHTSFAKDIECMLLVENHCLWQELLDAHGSEAMFTFLVECLCKYFAYFIGYDELLLPHMFVALERQLEHIAKQVREEAASEPE